MQLPYLKQLDGIRGIAALLVMTAHFHIFLPQDSLLVKANAVLGLTGVSLFFALSGFLITRILLATKDEPGFLKNFYARRTLRIFPLYYFSLILYYFILPPAIDRTSSPFGEQVWYWIYMQDFAQTFRWKSAGPGLFWSLAVEEHFYLFWPPIVYFAGRKHLPMAILTIIAISITVRYFLVSNHYDPYYFTFSRLEELVFGAALALCGFGEASSKRVWFSGLVFIVSMMLATALWSVFSGLANPGIRIIKYVIVSAMYVSLVGLAVSLSNKNFLNRFLKNRFLRYTGKISYGLYIFHPACFLFFDYYFKTENIALNFFLGILLTVLIADLSYSFLETPFLKMKERFYRSTCAARAQPQELIVKFQD